MTTKSQSALGEFEGRIVTKSPIKLTKAGDGLSTAMKIDPVALHQGDTVYVLMETTVGPITMNPYDDGVCARVQNLVAGVATIVDASVAKATIDAQREKNQRAEDEAKGQSTTTDFLELAEDHDKGLHDTPAPGCPKCAEKPGADEAPADKDAEVEPIKGRQGRPRGATKGTGKS